LRREVASRLVDPFVLAPIVAVVVVGGIAFYEELFVSQPVSVGERAVAMAVLVLSVLVIRFLGFAVGRVCSWVWIDDSESPTPLWSVVVPCVIWGGLLGYAGWKLMEFQEHWQLSWFWAVLPAGLASGWTAALIANLAASSETA